LDELGRMTRTREFTLKNEKNLIAASGLLKVYTGINRWIPLLLGWCKSVHLVRYGSGNLQRCKAVLESHTPENRDEQWPEMYLSRRTKNV
jgi:hypothetical protein